MIMRVLNNIFSYPFRSEMFEYLINWLLSKMRIRKDEEIEVQLKEIIIIKDKSGRVTKSDELDKASLSKDDRI